MFKCGFYQLAGLSIVVYTSCIQLNMSSFDSQPPNERKKFPESFTSDDVYDLIAWSFYDSQGSSDLQRDILGYYGMFLGSSEGVLPEKSLILPEGCGAASAKAVEKMTGHPKLGSGLATAGTESINALYEGYSRGQNWGEFVPTHLREYIYKITQAIILLDIKYFERRVSLLGSKAASGKEMYRVPSHLFHYGFSGQLTHYEGRFKPIIEDMYLRLVDIIKEYGARYSKNGEGGQLYELFLELRSMHDKYQKTTGE